MYYVDMPSQQEIGLLNSTRSDACVSIYLPTTPLTQEIEKSRIHLGNLLKKATAQLESAGFEKRKLASLEEQFQHLLDDDVFWAYQANSLAIFATPDAIRTYRLANKLAEAVEVSDRFHIIPLLRAVTFSQAAYVLALSENAVRVIEVSADLPAQELEIPNMPLNAEEVSNRATNKNYTGTGHRHGSQGESFHLPRYLRLIDAALRPVVQGSDKPLILATTKQLENLFRSISVIPAVDEAITGNPERLSASELADAARPVLDVYYAELVKAFHALYEERSGQQRTTTDISDAARLATFGGIDKLLIDMDSVVDGFIDEETGEVSFGAEGDAQNYSIIDEIAGRALRTGAKVMAVRKDDIPGHQQLAAILRYPI